jgi:SAM-dependent methyltransferase
MRVLVVIVSYGTKNDVYLERLLTEYRSMPYQLDLVVLSNIQKALGPAVEVIVEPPGSNRRALPFAHKQIFADRLNDYDLFIYTEDDVLVTDKNIVAFLEFSKLLPENQIPGFLRFERGSDGTISYCDMHACFDWDSQSVQSHGKSCFAFFSNEHAGCYLLTRGHLQRALDSRGFLVGPHRGRYNLVETAATDPYTQCGLRKMICISDLDRCCVHHLSNKYVGRFGIPHADLQLQIDALLEIEKNGGTCRPPHIRMDSQLSGFRYGKDHFGPVRHELFRLIPEGAKSVLTFGCGNTEIALASRGLQVTAVPVDPVVSVAAANKGVELVQGDIDSIMLQLKNRRFDCLLCLNTLHLAPDPAMLLSSLTRFLAKDAPIIIVVPNIWGMPFLLGWLRHRESRSFYRSAGVHVASARLVRKWMKRAGVAPGKPFFVQPPESRLPVSLRGSIFARMIENDIVVRGMLAGQPLSA